MTHSLPGCAPPQHLTKNLNAFAGDLSHAKATTRLGEENPPQKPDPRRRDERAERGETEPEETTTRAETAKNERNLHRSDGAAKRPARRQPETSQIPKKIFFRAIREAFRLGIFSDVGGTLRVRVCEPDPAESFRGYRVLGGVLRSWARARCCRRRSGVRDLPKVPRRR